MRKEIFFAGLVFIGSMTMSNMSYAEKNNIQVDDSYRLTLDLGTPRRYATRFDKETRTLQIRIIPARLDDVKNSSYYDSRYIKRIVVQEKESEVTLNIQLKNFPIGWAIATQKEPWRIIVDFWRTEQEKLSLNEQWNWQPSVLSGVVGDNISEGLPATSIPSSRGSSLSSRGSTAGSRPVQMAPEGKTARDDISVLPTEVVTREDKGATTASNKYDLPAIYSRLDLIKPLSDAKKADLNKQLGNVFGSKNEFLAAQNLADELYTGGQEAKALTIYRKLAALDEDKFRKSDKVLWQAGESAFLLKSFDIANDYFRTLLVNHPGSSLVPYAKLRITDIDELINSQNKGNGKVGAKNAETYSSLALSDKNPPVIKIAATLRVLDGVVDNDPDAVKLYQQNLDTCVTSGRIPFDLLKNCAYDRDRYLADKDNIPNADIAVQQFKKLSPGDIRTANLEKLVQGRVKTLLTEIAKSKDWNAWVEFEKKARPALLSFTFGDGEALFTRAEAFEAVGENAKAVQLYESFLKASSDTKKKNEANCLAALLLYRMNEPKKADEFLKRVEQDESRKTDGLTDKSVSALKELSVVPYRNKIALNVLMDEIKLGRYEERTLTTLSEWSKELRGTPQAELIYEKILAYPAKSLDEVQIVETSIMQFANDLRDSGRFSKSGDMFFAVANLSQGTRRAEAAYKAGVVYARAGLFDKAKTAWLLAANDTNDKRYSSLANERLDRINK